MRTHANPGANQLLIETLKLYDTEGHTLSDRAVGWTNSSSSSALSRNSGAFARPWRSWRARERLEGILRFRRGEIPADRYR